MLVARFESDFWGIRAEDDFSASNGSNATTTALVLHDDFSERRTVDPMLPLEASFQFVAHNTNNEHAKGQGSVMRPNRGEHPCFRFILAEHF